MSRWKVVRVKQELVDQIEKEVEKSEFKGLSEFVSDAIRHRLQALDKQKTSEYLARTRIIGVRTYTCSNDFVHNVKVVKYDDSSVWVMCSMFGWFEDAGFGGTPKLGCKERKKRCTWFVG